MIKLIEKCVSVVIPSYNRAHLLNETIPSYIQEHVGEVILVDDCSIDNTFEVVQQLQEKYPIIRYIKMETNSKQTAAKNRGVKEAKYPYVYLGDDDSFIIEGSISELLKTMKDNNADIVGAKALYMKSMDELIDLKAFIKENSRGPLSIEEALDINKLFYINFNFDVEVPQKAPFVHACALVKRDVFDIVKFDVTYEGNAFREETDFFTNASTIGKIIYYNSKAVQINLPRNIIIQKNSLIKYKIRSSYYEFWNTYKYLRKNIKFIQSYYGINKTHRDLWITYMKDAISVKLSKFYKLIGSRE